MSNTSLCGVTAQVTTLANFMETTKMRSAFTKNLLGGTILADMLAYM